jgi:hypothetical protein
MKAITANHGSCEFAAALKAARELHEMERLSATGPSHAQIKNLVENRLAQVSHRLGALHDHHTEMFEQVSLHTPLVPLTTQAA